MKFKLKAPYKPSGDQPKAIKELVEGIKRGYKNQTLLGVTGSGKTYVTANVIQQTQKPTLVISHNKTLAAQLFQEFREFFPDNAVEYFVSYYDYYQPESYLPVTDTYIEKDSDINEEIDKLRLSTTASLLTRRDVIVVASVSCIYNIGSPIEYQKQIIRLKKGLKFRQKDLLKRLTDLHYERSDYDFKRSTFRVKGDIVDVYPAYRSFAIRLEFLGDKIQHLNFFDPVSGEYLEETVDSGEETIIYPAKHYVAPEERYEQSVREISIDLEARLRELEDMGKHLEAHRLRQRTNYDLEMIQEIGYCKGIENYSRYFDGRKPGEPPYSLMNFLPDDYLLMIDESHITIPQVRGMYNGDRSRKQTLIDYGFRLPSALDNRPLKFDEFERRIGQTIYTSATPSQWEMTQSRQIVELLVRPTGLVDPEITIMPTKGQVLDLEKRIKDRVVEGSNAHGRILVTTLTKRMAEELADYLKEKGFKTAYLHSDIDTLERSDILDDLRKGNYDVLVGINLLREGLDLPEVTLVAILDADKEGFLRSETSLIQTMGRAARHIQGEVIMYADTITGSMQRAIDEVARRRQIQLDYNTQHNITPISISKPVRQRLFEKIEEPKISPIAQMHIQDYEFKTMPPKQQKNIIKTLESKMKSAAELLEFETAAEIRDKIRAYKKFAL